MFLFLKGLRQKFILNGMAFLGIISVLLILIILLSSLNFNRITRSFNYINTALFNNDRDISKNTPKPFISGSVVLSPTSILKLKPDDLPENRLRPARDWLSAKYKVSRQSLDGIMKETNKSAKKLGVDPLLVLSVMAVESNFKPKVTSHLGAIGLMQVMPQWHHDKFDVSQGYHALYDPATNIRVGTEILYLANRKYKNDELQSLQYYAGALKDPQKRYAKKVLSIKKKLEQLTKTDLSIQASS